MPPRVLHLIATLEKAGGAQRLLLEVLRRTQSRVPAAVAVLKGLSELDAEFAAIGVPVHDFRRRSPLDPLGARAVRRLLREGDFPLLHCHLSRAEIVGTLAVRKMPATKLVIHKHNDDAWWTKPGLAQMHRRIVTRADRVIVVSDAIGAYFQKLDPRITEKLIRVHNGVDAGRVERESAADRAVTRASLGLTPEEPVILTVGRLTRQKGHDVLIRALAAPSLAHAKLVIAGRGEERDPLAAAARSAGVETRVIFAGVRSDVPALMGACDVLAMPSRWEGFGLVIVEAMCAARPVVATRVSAIPEVVEQEVTGLLVPPEDPAALAAAIARVLGDRSLARRMGEAGRARARARFDISATATGWLDVWRSLGVEVSP